MKITIAALILLCCYGLQSQSIDRSVLGPAGHSGASPTILLDWTLGEIAGQTHTTRSGFLTEGFQQPALRIERISQGMNDLRIAVFPNPARNELSISMQGSSGDFFDYVLRDIAGKELQHRKQLLSASRHRLDISALPKGIYLLSIDPQDGSLPQSFRILKAR